MPPTSLESDMKGSTGRKRTFIIRDQDVKISTPLHKKAKLATENTTSMANRGQDGKPLYLSVGVLKQKSHITIFAKKNNIINATANQKHLHWFVDQAVFSQTGAYRNNFSFAEIDFNAQYNKGSAEEIKEHIASLLCATDFLKLGELGEQAGRQYESAQAAVSGLPDGGNVEDLVPNSRPKTQAKSRREGSDETLALNSEYNLKSGRRLPNIALESHRAAKKLFEQTIRTIEEPLRKYIEELETTNTALQKARDSAMARTAAMEDKIKDLEAAVAKSDAKLSEKSQLDGKTKDNCLVPLPQNANKNNTVNGQVYEVLEGLNHGYLRGAEGKLHVRDDAACRDYVILREKTAYQFVGTSRDEVVEIDGQSSRREVVVPGGAGSWTKHEMVKSLDTVAAEGGKEYEVYKCTKLTYM